MTEPHDLIMERPRQERLARLGGGHRAHESLIVGSLGIQVSHEARTAAIEAPLERIEARLDLREQ